MNNGKFVEQLKTQIEEAIAPPPPKPGEREGIAFLKTVLGKKRHRRGWAST